MTYKDVADLAVDQEYLRRLTAALVSEAAVKADDALADSIVRNPGGSSRIFGPLVATAPGFGDKFADGGSESITDGELLAAVQANWDKVAGLTAVGPTP